MASQLVTNGLYQCRIWYTQAEQAAVSTVYYNVLNQTGSAVSDADLAIAFEAAIYIACKTLVSSDVSFRGVQVFLTNPVAGAPAPAPQFSNVHSGGGNQLPPDLPRQVSGLIEWTTNFAGRRYRGHLYQPFPASVYVATDGIPTAAYQTNLLILANALLGLTTINNAGFTGTATVAMYLHHRPGKSPTPNATPITGKVVGTKFATQKRRGSYGRPNNSPI